MENFKAQVAEQLNIDESTIVFAKKTWKHWVIQFKCWSEDEVLIVVIPHDKFMGMTYLIEAINGYAV